MERNRNVELMRGWAILVTLGYHYCVTSGIAVGGIHRIIIEAFIQVGMFSFFAISGFGTWSYFHRVEALQDKQKPWGFFVYRLKKIIPAYYHCILLVVLVITPIYFSGAWKAILVYLLFIQNLIPAYSGAINGVTWTIAVMVQFYLFAPFFYRLFCKLKWKLYLIAIALSAICKIVLDEIITKCVTVEGDKTIYYVIANMRQLPTTIEHFVAGMCVAWVLDEIQNGRKKAIPQWLCCFFCITLIPTEVGCFLLGWLHFQAVWNGTIWTFIWPPLLGAMVALYLLSLSQLKLPLNNPIMKIFLFVAKYEYNIYLWHMILFTNLYNTIFFQSAVAKGYVLPAIIVSMIIACIFGCVMTLFTSSIKIYAAHGSDLHKEN